MYELIILSLLMRQPAHGYLFGKVLNNMIGPVARASNGRIYPLLAKLEADGLVTAWDQEHEGRPMRTYQITAAGKQRFRALMLDTASNPREYPELFALKVTVFPLIPLEERLMLIDHYTGFVEAHIQHLSAGVQDLEAGRIPGETDPLREVLQHRIEQWQLERTWAKGLKERAYEL
ncbi:MAG: helix-turn-helix transcriptional regulator [Bacillota bacterium]